MAGWRDAWRSPTFVRRIAWSGQGSGMLFNNATNRALFAFKAPEVSDTLNLHTFFSMGRGGTHVDTMRVDLHAFNTSTLLHTGPVLQTVFVGPSAEGSFFSTGALSLATTAGQWLCAIVSNVAVDPITNWFRTSFPAANVGDSIFTGPYRTSTDSGATWVPVPTGVAIGHNSMVPRFTNFGHHSAPTCRLFTTMTTGVAISANGTTYRGRNGCEYEFEEDVVLQALAQTRLERSGSPMWDVRAEIWSNGSLVATSANALPTGPAEQSGPWWFTNTTLRAGVRYQIVVAPVLDTTPTGSVAASIGWTEPHSSEWTIGPVRRGVTSTNFSGPPSFVRSALVGQSLLVAASPLVFAPSSYGGGYL